MGLWAKTPSVSLVQGRVRDLELELTSAGAKRESSRVAGKVDRPMLKIYPDGRNWGRLRPTKEPALATLIKREDLEDFSIFAPLVVVRQSGQNTVHARCRSAIAVRCL